MQDMVRSASLMMLLKQINACLYTDHLDVIDKPLAFSTVVVEMIETHLRRCGQF